MASRRKRKRSGGRFIQLFGFVKRSQAYHDLSVYARCALIEIMDRYNGINNGMIGLGVRELAKELGCSQGRASSALRELDDANLARPVTGGLWKGKRATEWRLTFHRCDKTGELPIKSFPAHQQFTSRSTKVRQEEQNVHTSSRPEAHKPKSSMSAPAKCSSDDTHVDIYQGESDAMAVSGPRLLARPHRGTEVPNGAAVPSDKAIGTGLARSE